MRDSLISIVALASLASVTLLSAGNPAAAKARTCQQKATAVREPLRRAIRFQQLCELHLSHLRQAVRHLRPRLSATNGGPAPPCAGGRAQSRSAATLQLS